MHICKPRTASVLDAILKTMLLIW